jgi:nucleoside-triphosphatase THEP1
MWSYQVRLTERVHRVFDSPRTVVATVHRHAHPVTDALKARRDVRVVHLDRDTRNELPRRILRELVDNRSDRPAR